MRILIDGETVQVIHEEYVYYQFVFHPRCRYGEATQIEVIDDVDRNFHYTNQYILNDLCLYEIQIDRHNVRVIDTDHMQEIHGVIPSRIRNNEFTARVIGTYEASSINNVWYDELSMGGDWTDCFKKCEHEFVPSESSHLEKCKLCGEQRLIVPESLDKIHERLYAIG